MEELLKDWLERDGETFVHKRKVGRLGWEETLTSRNYSEAIINDPTPKQLIENGYNIARSVIASMPHDKKLKIKIGGRKSYTDGQSIQVATSMFDEEKLEPAERLDAFIGTAVHEGLHVLYTDWDNVPRGCSELEKNIFNIIEDECIERRCGEELPGLANFLEKAKHYHFESFARRTKVTATSEKEKTLLELVQLLLQFVRYPKYLTEERIENHVGYLRQIKEALTPFPTNTLEAKNATKQIIEIIKHLIENPEEISESASGAGSGDESEEDSDEQSDSTSKSPSSPSSSPSSGDEKSGKADRKSEMSNAELDRLASKILSALEQLGETKTEASKEVVADPVFCAEVEGTITLSKDTSFRKAKENKYSYEEAYNEIRPYINAMSKILQTNYKDHKLVHKGMRSGVLDTSKLAEAYQAVPNVYVRVGEVKTEKVPIVLLIDQSGSMYPLVKYAIQTAVLLKEAFSRVPNVELFIYGHTADQLRSGLTEITTFYEGSFRPKYALGSISAIYENRDGTAILSTAQRVRTFTDKQALMFVISDGCPSADDYRGSSAMEDTRKKVEQVERMGFDVVQVCIHKSYDPGRMFKHFVVLEDMKTLAVSLSKIVKKATLKKSRNYEV